MYLSIAGDLWVQLVPRITFRRIYHSDVTQPMSMKIVNDMRCHERYIDSEIDGIKQ